VQATAVKPDTITVDHTPVKRTDGDFAPDYAHATLEKTEAPGRVKEILPGVDFYIKTIPANPMIQPSADLKEIMAMYNEKEFVMPRTIWYLYDALGKTPGDEESLELLIYLQMWAKQVEDSRYASERKNIETFDLNNDIKIGKIQIKEVKKYNWIWYTSINFTCKNIDYEALFSKRFGQIDGICIYKNNRVYTNSGLDFLIKK
jgi:hypothetical protein